ncbi:2'-5' RNA ligase family protein [Micromonospora sp. NPDC047707]|uniref:2'-5' RNA ligase family protein n=1 Tax=Micromonospora sp. NPDC047707 TaxID=3154498 RepID=UPI0034525E49
MSASVEHVDQMRDHWWWRPGWRVGRHFYACHFVMGDHSELVELVQRYQEVLRPFPRLDLIPAAWLHLTMQGIDFVDEVDEEQVALLKQAIRGKLAQVPAPVVTFHRPVVRPEAVYLLAEPPAPIAAVREVVRAAIGEVLGADVVELTPERRQGYRPHVSLAYSNAIQPAGPIATALAQLEVDPVTLTLDRLGLLEFHRDHRMYQWTRSEQMTLGRCCRHSSTV